jgi:hypothetical protein
VTQYLDKFVGKVYSEPAHERGSMVWNKRITVFLILLFLVSTVVAASHHHENTADDHECPICIASNHLAATSQWVVAFDSVPYFTETTVVAPSSVLADTLFSTSRRNRAPPV